MIVRKLFTDGGLITPNPSKVGGLWAWCEIETDVDEATGAFTERIFASNSGILYPGDLHRDIVTSINTETLAVIEAIEQIPTYYDEELHQHVILHSDNKFALGALLWGYRTDSVPPELLYRLGEQKRRIEHGCITVEGKLLGGHPTPDDVRGGYRQPRLSRDGKIVKSGMPCSVWNVWCDTECNRVKSDIRVKLGIDPPPVHKLTQEEKRAIKAAEKEAKRQERIAEEAKKKQARFDKNGIPFRGSAGRVASPAVPVRIIEIPALASASVKAEQMDMFAGAV